MATKTTGPLVADRNTMSIVFQVLNNTEDSQQVQVSVYDLSSCPKEEVFTEEIEVNPNEASGTILPQPPTRFEIVVEGLEENMEVWVAGRTARQNIDLNLSAFLPQNLVHNQEMVTVGDLLPGPQGYTTGPLVADRLAQSLIVEVLNSTLEEQSVMVTVYDTSVSPKQPVASQTFNLEADCSDFIIFPDPPTQYEVMFTASSDGVYGFTSTRTQVQSAAISLTNLLAPNEMSHGNLTPVDTPLDAVNEAETVEEMRAAIENPALGLDLTDYNMLSDELKDEVAQTLLDNRPEEGYPTVLSVQLALDEAVNNIVDPNNIYVEAGSSGNGSRAMPFGTIQQGIAAVNPGGTVNILSGTYPITSQINVNKAGITLLGEPGTLLELQADTIALLTTQPNITIDGLTITSDMPYPKEFIQIGGNNNVLRNNTIFGPEQQGDSSTWVVNRAVVSQGGLEVTLEGNTFYSLRTGMYINPNTTGEINNNVVYNTRGGFLVDRAFTTFVGNSWGTPPNFFDIVLLAGTTEGPPYDNLAELSAENDNATISDQRE
ncbi:DUF1565 domain-containing protein [Halobacillus halophilus]|uniref:DUF1565 domain-containing protein n=1 Tax=Halobacillus halophilus TaxID=1570 RepID=UPI001CD7FCD2|nr:DUF1565 domain-containing protein [Halobacillus halophilus]MCA1009185.1 DUF1565 domain-containing protein [Halobacillus halophilus]